MTESKQQKGYVRLAIVRIDEQDPTLSCSQCQDPIDMGDIVQRMELYDETNEVLLGTAYNCADCKISFEAQH